MHTLTSVIVCFNEGPKVVQKHLDQPRVIAARTEIPAEQTPHPDTIRKHGGSLLPQKN